MAKKSTDKFQPHQERVIKRITATDSPHGLIAYHSLGSGKTYTALGALDATLKTNPDARGLFVVPASLVDNVKKEIVKHNLNHLNKRIDIYSYEKATKIAPELASKNYALSVFDEAHRLRNKDTLRARHLQGVVDNSNKVLLLTGTAGYNHPADIANLINIINPNENLPVDKNEFEKEFINNLTWKLKRKEYLRSVLNKYIDRHQNALTEDYPSVTRKVIPVEMTKRQADLYRIVERSIPSEIRYKLQNNLPMSLQDSKSLNLFSQGIRQASNSPVHHDITATYKDSPKLLAAAESMANMAKTTKGFRGVAYSNYLDAGLNPYTDALRAHGLEPLVFTGKLNSKDKKAIIDAYNSASSKPQILLLSSSGGEGIDLKRTRLMQILEPHFNKSKIRQAEGRAIRYKSHEDLPKKDRNVLVEEYRSRLPKTRFQQLFGLDANTAIDDYLADLSDQKQGIVDEIDSLINS